MADTGRLRVTVSRDFTWAVVHHTPVWVPALLPVDEAGNTAPGFVCAHQLENGAGQCGRNVFNLDQAVGDHGCVVRTTPVASDATGA